MLSRRNSNAANERDFCEKNNDAKYPLSEYTLGYANVATDDVSRAITETEIERRDTNNNVDI